MSESYSLKLLRIPVWILFFGILEVLAEFDVVIEVLKCMFEPIVEDGGGPIVRSPLISIDDMDEDSEFGFVCVVFEDFDDLGLGNVLVLDGKAAFYMFVHFFGH